jgi:hypothetical protein
LGDRLDTGPLTADERRLLDRLTHDDRPDVVTDAPEDSPAAARAVADDTVLPHDAGLRDAGDPTSRES